MQCAAKQSRDLPAEALRFKHMQGVGVLLSGEFGAGTVVGNNIFFSPTSFIAMSANGDGAVTTTATLNIDIEVNAGSSYAIGGFGAAEAGDYLLSGGTSVGAVGRLQVTSLTTTACGLFCIATDLFSAGALSDQGALTEWAATGTVDLTDIAGWGSDTHVQAQIQNVLSATSTVLGDSALVQKKFVGIGVESVSQVPLPAGVWLFGSAIAGLAGLRRFRA